MAGPYASITSPYAPGSDRMHNALRISDLIAQQGQSAAHAQLTKGLMVGNLVGDIGGTVGGLFARRDQARADQQEAQFVAELLASGQPVDLAALVQKLGPDRAKTLYPMIEAEVTKRTAASKEANELGLRQRHADALKQGADPNAINIERWGEGAAPLPASMVPDPTKVAAAAAAAAEKKARTDLEAALNAAGGDPEQERRAYRAFNAATGKDAPAGLFTPAPKADDQPKLGEFSDYLTRYARDIAKKPVDTLTAADMEDARKRFLQADDRPRIEFPPGANPAQVAMFNRLAGEFERSPLSQAANRTVTLKSAIRDIRADPANPTNQMALSYGYIQALDTYQSAVREGELSNLQNLGTAFQNLGVQARRVFEQGAVVPPEVAKQIADNAERMITAIEQGRAASRRTYANRATVAGIGDLWKQFDSLEAAPQGGGGAPGGGGGTTPGAETAPAEVRARLLGNDPATGKPYPDGIITMNNGRKFRKLNGVITEVK